MFGCAHSRARSDTAAAVTVVTVVVVESVWDQSVCVFCRRGRSCRSVTHPRVCVRSCVRHITVKQTHRAPTHAHTHIHSPCAPLSARTRPKGVSIAQRRVARAHTHTPRHAQRKRHNFFLPSFFYHRWDLRELTTEVKHTLASFFKNISISVISCSECES